MASNYTDFDEGAKLYRRYQNGDENAFEELVTLYRGGLTNYINAFISDRREAEELAIDAFAEFAADMKYKCKSSVKTYLFAIGRHLALRHAKQYMSTNHILLDEIIDELGMDENTVEGEYLRGEQKERLIAAMQTLKPEHRESLRLIYFENMSYADAGRIMNKTETQITNLAHRAKASLKKMLASEGMEA